MIFFRDNAPPIEDYDKTLNELIDLGWIQKIYNVEMNKSIYDTTSLGYQYYFAICMKIGYAQMFGGPTLTEGQTTAYIDADIDLVEEGYLIDGIDSAKLTPTAAEYLYVLTDAHGKEVKVKKQKNNQKGFAMLQGFRQNVESFMLLITIQIANSRKKREPKFHKRFKMSRHNMVFICQ